MAGRRMRMAELSRESGLTRETIHYYMREGLLPQPIKAGRTLSFYDDSHVERLRLIRRLREDKYLPLAVIRRMIEVGLSRSHASDLDTLADVLAIDPTLSRGDAGEPAPDADAMRTALDLGLLGRERGAAHARPGLVEDRVLGAVAEALALEPTARELTLADMRACAGELTRLVEAEAGLFFDVVFRTGDATSSVRALRAGRAPVARFIAAYRDLMLRRMVEEIFTALAVGARVFDGPPLLDLGAIRLGQLGVERRREELLEHARAGDAATANDLVWLLFSVGPRSALAGLPASVRRLLRPRAALLVAAAGSDAGSDLEALERALDGAGPFALGEVLLAQARLARSAAGGEADRGFLDRIVPALAGLYAAKPQTDADPLAAASAFQLRGRVALGLPRVLGWRGRAVDDLECALEVVLGAPGRVDPAASARIEGDCRLLLGQVRAADGDVPAARDQLERARAVDPTGPIGEAAALALEELAARLDPDATKLPASGPRW